MIENIFQLAILCLPFFIALMILGAISDGLDAMRSARENAKASRNSRADRR